MITKVHGQGWQFLLTSMKERFSRIVRQPNSAKKYLNEEYIQHLCESRPCGEGNGMISIHAECRALYDYRRRVSKKKMRRGFCIYTYRRRYNQEEKKYELGNAKPCGLCLHHTIRVFLRDNGISPEKVNVCYTVPGGYMKTTYLQLCKETPYITTGIRFCSHASHASH